MTEITPEAQSASKQAKTAVTMVLDRSGSMGDCRAATIESVNAYLTKSSNDDNLKDADFELAIFDTEAYETIRNCKISAATAITPDEFVPRGGTPLLDAVGRGIDGLDKRASDDKAILVIVTDGLENSSRKHSYESIKALLDDRQSRGWLVLFLGAGLDSARQGLRMGVASPNVASIGLDEVYLRASMDAMADANSAYAAAPSRGARQYYVDSEKFSPERRKTMGDSTGGHGLKEDENGGNGIGRLFRRGKKAPAASATPAADHDAWREPRSDAWND